MKYGPEKSATDKETEKTLRKRKICIPDAPGACFRSCGRPIFAGKITDMEERRICGDGDTVQRYVDILSDAGFKAVFGDQKNKDVLMDLLNVVLPPHRRVKDIEYSTTELPGFTPEGKSVRLDLRCTGEDGTGFIVEMQNSRQRHFFKRCVEYAAKVYDSGSRRGGGYSDIPPVYFIGIVSADMGFDRSGEEWRDRYISSYGFMEKESHEVAEETILINFVELDRFTKGLEESEGTVEKWCYALKHMWKLHDLPDGLRQAVFERLFEACEIARFSPDKRLIYEKEMITERDYRNILETAREDGFAEGEAKGKAEGSAAKAAEIARAMLASGMDIPLISSLTGLPEEEVKRL